MRENGLLLGQRLAAAYTPRIHDGKIAVKESNVRWCSDGFEITCHSKEKVRVAFALDCCDREAMSWVATTKGIDSEMIQDLMLQALEDRFGGRDLASDDRVADGQWKLLHRAADSEFRLTDRLKAAHNGD